MPPTLFLLRVLLAFALATTLARAQSLPATVEQALKRAQIPLSAVAAYVQDVDGGRPLVAHHAAQSMNPASTMTRGSCLRAPSIASWRSSTDVTRTIPSEDPARAGLTNTGRPMRCDEIAGTTHPNQSLLLHMLAPFLSHPSTGSSWYAVARIPPHDARLPPRFLRRAGALHVRRRPHFRVVAAAGASPLYCCRARV